MTIQEKLLIFFTAGYFSLFLLYKIKLNTLKLDAEKVRSQQLYLIAKLIILFIDNAVVYARQIATEAAESKAPPTAPPVSDIPAAVNPAIDQLDPIEFEKIKKTISTLIYDPIASEITLNDSLIRPFLIQNQEIKEYIINRLAAETQKYPDKYNIFTNIYSKKNIWKIKIREHFKNLDDAAKKYIKIKDKLNDGGTRIKDLDLIIAINALWDLQNCQQNSLNEKIYDDSKKEKIENIANFEWVTYELPILPVLLNNKEQSLFDLNKQKNYNHKKPYKPRQKINLFSKICESENKNLKKPIFDFIMTEVQNG